MGNAVMREFNYAIGLVIVGVVFVVLAGLLFYNTVKPLPFNDKLWQESSGRTRGRMVHDLLDNNDFTGFSRGEVITWLGAPDLDERLYWYDLGPSDAPREFDGRTPVGDSSHFIIAFRADIQNQIDQVLLDRRPSTPGTEKFDELVWEAATPVERAAMVTDLVGHYRWVGRPVEELQEKLGPPDGELFRTHYNVGFAGKIYSFNHALIFVFDRDSRVQKYYLQ